MNLNFLIIGYAPRQATGNPIKLQTSRSFKTKTGIPKETSFGLSSGLEPR